MTIKKRYVEATLETDSQEINIFKLGTESEWHISTTIPKFARKYRPYLVDGEEVFNTETGSLVEIHGVMDNNAVSLTRRREMSEEERQILRERMQDMRARISRNTSTN